MTAPEKKEKLHKILDLVLDINAYKGKCNDSLPKAFLTFQGHCNSIDVSIFVEGWKSGKKPLIRNNCYIDRDVNDARESDRELSKIIKKLEAVKELLYPEETKCIQCNQTGAKADMLETVDGNVCEACMEEV